MALMPPPPVPPPPEVPPPPPPAPPTSSPFGNTSNFMKWLDLCTLCRNKNQVEQSDFRWLQYYSSAELLPTDRGLLSREPQPRFQRGESLPDWTVRRELS